MLVFFAGGAERTVALVKLGRALHWRTTPNYKNKQFQEGLFLLRCVKQGSLLTAQSGELLLYDPVPVVLCVAFSDIFFSGMTAWFASYRAPTQAIETQLLWRSMLEHELRCPSKAPILPN